VLLGNGDGTFRTAVDYDSGGSFPNSVAIADVNGDGKLDVVVANSCSSGGYCSAVGEVAILLGNGDGTFQAARTYNTGGFSSEYVLVADVNGDGKLDLLVVNLCNSPCDDIGPPEGSVGVLLGNGDGTFKAAVTYDSGGYFAFGLAVADLNGDGRPDLVVANFCNVSSCFVNPYPLPEGAIGVLVGKGDGTFQPVVAYDPGGQGTKSVAIADVNRDGKADLLSANCGPEACGPGRAGGTVGILLGNGDGTFQAAASYSAGNSPDSIASADMNGDGRPDVVVGNWGTSNGGSNNGAVTTLVGNGDGTFQPATSFPSGGAEVPSISIADVNSDGMLDVVAANVDDIMTGAIGVVSVLLNGTGLSQAPTTTSVTSLLNPSTYGQAVTFTAKVTSSSGTPTGTAILYNGTTSVGSGTLINGSASIVVSSLAVGSHSMTAAYQGNASFAGSTSAPLAQTVKVATTTTSLTSSLNPAGTNQSVTFTATVASEFGGAATGPVVFSSGSQTLGTASLSGNIASLTTSFSTSGTYSISAKYNGDGNNSGSTSSALSEVVKTATTTMLASSLNPSVVGQAVTFRATVSSTAGTPPNGEAITFKDGSAVLGTATLSGGLASLMTSSLPAGIFTITANYPGDRNFAASTSPGLRQMVNSTTKSATATTLVSSLNPSIYGQKVTWTATVTTSGSVPPTGNVNFKWNGNSIGSATLNASGVATLTGSNLSADAYPLTAVYKGDTSNLGSMSAVVSQVITQATSYATLTSSPNPSTSGQPVTFTAMIKSSTVTPTGPVTFAVGTTVLGTAQLSGGKAVFTTSTLAVGSTKVTATYHGNSNIAKSSASVTHTVQ